MIPTLVSNCAPFTPVIVAYYPDHTICKIDYAKGAYMTIVDTVFTSHTVDYFIAGIADTLAKYYEMEAIVATWRRRQDCLSTARFPKRSLIKNLLIADAIKLSKT